VAGKFITFEGIDGAGKSTHVVEAVEHLQRGGAEVVRTREPGGTELAEALRALLLRTPMDPMTEALLVFAARRDHLQRVIEPALARGATVLCDRFSDATFAYQGHGRGFDLGMLGQLERWVHPDRRPDLTLWFDLDPSIAIRRVAAAREADRFEAQDLGFFERVRDGYRARMQAEPERFARIDAAADKAEVKRAVAAALRSRGW
jgi:dTMP kinase